MIDLKKIQQTNSFTLLTQLLVIILPFYVIIKVFFELKLGINGFGIFIKEFLILLLFVNLSYEYYKIKKIPKFEWLDYLIFGYFLYGIIITFVNGLGIQALFYGGRYDFIFFVVFLIFRHGQQFLQISNEKLCKLFLLSASISLFFSVTIKLIGEEFLRLFGFNFYMSNWTFNGSVPIYHGVEGSGIRRFQGIFDGPNQMAFFLILYAGIILHVSRKKLEFYHGVLLPFILILIVLTYSRSALLGIFGAGTILILFNIKHIFTKYKKQILYSIPLLLIFGGVLFISFERNIYNIIMRPASTSGHFERMEVGLQKFREKPLGHGLATSGPAYRQVFSKKITKEQEKYFIPESWFIQQLVEGGILYFFLFMSILSIILHTLYKKSKYFFAAFVAILVMNIFLHIFEATYLSVLLFVFIGILSSKKSLET